MAPERSVKARQNVVKRPLIQPALPLLPGLNKNKTVLVTEQPASDVLNNGPSELPQTTTTSADPDTTSNYIHTTQSDNAPEVLLEAPTESAKVPAEPTIESLLENNVIGQEDESGPGQDLETALEHHELAETQSDREVVGDEPVSVASYSQRATDNTFGDASIAMSRASPQPHEPQQDDHTVTTERPVHPVMPTEIDGKSAEFSAHDDQSRHAPSEESGRYGATFDEGYASNDRTGATSTNSPHSGQSNDNGPIPQFSAPEPPPFVSLNDHLLQLSNSKAWADCVILLNNKLPQPAMCYAHSMMLIRSPRLRKLMERQGGMQNNTLTMSSPMAIMPHAFEAALRFLYSDAILTAEALFPRQMSSDLRQLRSSILPYILSYWASGLLLGIDHVVVRAHKLLSEFLGWDVLEALVREAEYLASGIDTETMESDLDWSSLVTQWKSIALEFCATTVDPRTISVDTTAMSLVRSRFGTLEESRNKHNPALASMVFGSMPPSEEMSPTSPPAESFQSPSSLSESSTSSILVNADFQDLLEWHRLSKRAWADAGDQLLTDIVREREARRLKIVHNQAMPNKQRMANSTVWDVVGWREMVQNGELKRERVGFLLPAHR